MGEARPLKLLNVAAWLISTCLCLLPFCLHLGDRALAQCILTLYVYMQRQKQETSKQAMKEKDAKSIWKRKKADKHDRHSKQRNKKASKQARRQANKKVNKRWYSRGTNVGLDRMSITSLGWSMDDTLASKTYAWTCKQACRDAWKSQRVAQTSMVSIASCAAEKGRVRTKQPDIQRCLPNSHIQTRLYGHRM